MWVFIAQKPGKLSARVPVLVYLPFRLHFAPPPHHPTRFLASNCLQTSLFTDLLEGVPSYNPPVRKSAFLAFDHFLIEPPFIATLRTSTCFPINHPDFCFQIYCKRGGSADLGEAEDENWDPPRHRMLFDLSFVRHFLFGFQGH